MGQGLRQHKIFFTVNPMASGGRAALLWQDILPALERQGLNFFWQYSAGGFLTSRQIHEAVLEKGATAVISVGGDGHLHDTLNGMIENDALIQPNLVLGAFPAGSGSDFLRMIYLTRGDTSVNGFIRLLLNGKIKNIDVGCADFYNAAGEPTQAYFVNGGDIGLGAVASLRVNADNGRYKRIFKNGQWAFFLATWQSLFSYHCCPMSVEADGDKLDGKYLIASFGNGRFMGGKMCLFPQAQLDDGLLDLFLVPQVSKFKVLRLFGKVYDGTVLQVEEVYYRRVKTLTINPEQPLPLELDGEVPGRAPFSVRVLPQFLPLLQFDK